MSPKRGAVDSGRRIYVYQLLASNKQKRRSASNWCRAIEAWVFRNRRDCCQKRLRPVGLGERWLETEQASEGRRHFAPSVTRRRGKDERGRCIAWGLAFSRSATNTQPNSYPRSLVLLSQAHSTVSRELYQALAMSTPPSPLPVRPPHQYTPSRRRDLQDPHRIKTRPCKAARDGFERHREARYVSLYLLAHI